MRTCSSETAGHRWIWVAPIFGMLQWLKQTWIGNHSLCQATQTSSVPTFNVSNEQLRSPGAICTSSVQANVAKEPGTLSDFWVHHCHVKDIERLVLYEGYPEFILMVWLICSFCLWWTPRRLIKYVFGSRQRLRNAMNPTDMGSWSWT